MGTAQSTAAPPQHVRALAERYVKTITYMVATAEHRMADWDIDAWQRAYDKLVMQMARSLPSWDESALCRAQLRGVAALLRDAEGRLERAIAALPTTPDGDWWRATLAERPPLTRGDTLRSVGAFRERYARAVHSKPPVTMRHPLAGPWRGVGPRDPLPALMMAADEYERALTALMHLPYAATDCITTEVSRLVQAEKALRAALEAALREDEMVVRSARRLVDTALGRVERDAAASGTFCVFDFVQPFTVDLKPCAPRIVFSA